MLLVAHLQVARGDDLGEVMQLVYAVHHLPELSKSHS